MTPADSLSSSKWSLGCYAIKNVSLNESARAMQCFSKNSHCDLSLGPRTVKLKIVQDIVIPYNCGKLNQN